MASETAMVPTMDERFVQNMFQAMFQQFAGQQAKKIAEAHVPAPESMSMPTPGPMSDEEPPMSPQQQVPVVKEPAVVKEEVELSPQITMEWFGKLPPDVEKDTIHFIWSKFTKKPWARFDRKNKGKGKKGVPHKVSPDDSRCCAKKKDGGRCTRRKKDGGNVCGIHKRCQAVFNNDS